MNTTDRELLELAAKAAALDVVNWNEQLPSDKGMCRGAWIREGGAQRYWNPLNDDGDRYRLAKQLCINVDFHDCCAWKRLPNGDLIQEFWGGEYGDEAHAVVRAAAEIGRMKGKE